MSIIYCDTCGMHVESDSTGTVRTCGLANSDSYSDEDHGYANDCPFDNDLTIEDYDDEEYEEYEDDYEDGDADLCTRES